MRDFQRAGRFGFEDIQLLLRPFARFGLKGEEGVFDGRFPEAALDFVDVFLERAGLVPVHRLQQAQTTIAHRALDDIND